MTKAAKMSITELRNRLDAASQRVSDASRSVSSLVVKILTDWARAQGLLK